MEVKLLIMLAFCLKIHALAMNLKCSKSVREHNRFYLLRHCQRSQQPVVGLVNAESVRECATFTKASRGLAFNYSPFKQSIHSFGLESKSGNETQFPRKLLRHHIVEQPEEFYRCHALACPETGNATALVNDRRFNYYTLYASAIPPLNTTCIPEIGIFQLYNTLRNYSAAFKTCATESKGALAHVLSESRNKGLAALLQTSFNDKDTKHRAAYVGLNYSYPEKEFHTTEWENLNCFGYRAWAPGHPRKHDNHSCVAIRVDSTWTTTDCNKSLPFICEIYTSGPRVNNPDYGY